MLALETLPGLQRKNPTASGIAGGHGPSEPLPPCKAATGKITARISSSFCNTEFLTVVCFPGQSFISTLPAWKHLSHINVAIRENIRMAEWNYRDMQKEGSDC